MNRSSTISSDPKISSIKNRIAGWSLITSWDGRQPSSHDVIIISWVDSKSSHEILLRPWWCPCGSVNGCTPAGRIVEHNASGWVVTFSVAKNPAGRGRLHGYQWFLHFNYHYTVHIRHQFTHLRLLIEHKHSTDYYWGTLASWSKRITVTALTSAIASWWLSQSFSNDPEGVRWLSAYCAQHLTEYLCLPFSVFSVQSESAALL